jgi:hypothetical protein
MSITNRETVRDALGTLLSAALVGTGKPSQAFYGYMVGDFAGQSPVVVLTSAGTDPEQRAVTSRQKNDFYFTIFTFTLYAQAGSSYGEDDVEDLVDLLEKTIRETVADNRSTASWAFIEYEGRSTVDTVLVAGEEYRREAIPIRIKAYDN